MFCFLLQGALFGNVTGVSFKYPEESQFISEREEEAEVSLIGKGATLPNSLIDLTIPRWVAYYGNKALPSSFYNYDPIVFYPQEHPTLAPLMVSGKTLLAYISLADIGAKDVFYQEVKSNKLLLDKNPCNGERFLIDVRNSRWEELLLGKIIPEILAEGFNGICLCNIDALVTLELYNPVKYEGLTKAAIKLLAKIRERFSGYKIMLDMNGLLHISEHFIEHADMVLYEHLSTKQEGKATLLRSAQDYILVARQLQDLALKKEGLKIYTLDFWPEKDKKIVKGIYEQQRKYGFIPYIAENLLKITEEPSKG